MVAVTARTAAGLQVEAQASLDSRKHERRTDGKPGQGRTPSYIGEGRTSMRANSAGRRCSAGARPASTPAAVE